MGVSIFFIAAMVLVGGVVAYLGDLIGRRLGKKRLSFKRLRPKHTAALGTFIAGMIGTLVTIGVLFAAVEPVRVWILEGDKARAELVKVQQELTDAKAQRTDIEKRLTDSEGKLTASNESLASSQNELKTVQIDLDAARKDSARAAVEAKKLRDQAGMLARDVQRYTKELKKSSDEVKALAAQSKNLQAQIDRQIRESGRLEGDNKLLQTRNLELENLNIDLEARVNESTTKVDGLETAYSELNSAYQRLNETFEKQQNQNRADLEAAQKQLSSLNADVEQLRNARDALRNMVDQSRLQPLIYNIGDELARLSVGDRLNLAEAQNYFAAAVERAEDDARQNGAAGRFAVIRPFQGLNPEQITERALRQLSGKNFEQVILLRTLANGFKLEEIPISVFVLPNPIVYQEGDMVIEVQVDGRLTDSQIADQILDTLSANLTKTAVEKGMIPAIGKPNPLGELNRETVLQMVDRVKEANRPIRLQLLAERETRAADELRLTFRLRP
ncbi:MAG: DUF3084 domain-containing protein [Armatimonadetes bacterium]|nr:DUF3084 domain-containing protein [Armatimonadota bacterium]